MRQPGEVYVRWLSAKGFSRLVLCCSIALGAGACDGTAVDNASSEPAVPTRDAQPIARICADIDAPGCTMGPLIEAVPLEDGGTLVAHAGGPLFLFDSAGAFRDSVGRLGQGPGEFESILRVGLIGADSIAVVDVRRFTVVFLPRSGAGGRSEPIPFEPSFEDTRVSSRARYLFAVPGVDSAGARADGFVLAFNGENVRRHTTVRAISYRMPGSDMSRPRGHFAPRTNWCVSPQGRIAFAHGDTWTLDLVDTLGAVSEVTLDGFKRDAIELVDFQLATGSFGGNQARADSAAARQFAGPIKQHPTVFSMACDDEHIVLATSGNASKGSATWRLVNWAGQETLRLRVPTDARLSSVGFGRLSVFRQDTATGAQIVELVSLSN